MSILDGFDLFEPATGTAITSSAVSTNVLDLGTGSGASQGRDIAAGWSKVNELYVVALSAFTSASNNTTLNVQLQMAPDNGSGSPGGWQTIYETSPQYLGQLVAGQKIFQGSIAAIAEAFIAPSPVTTFSCSSGSGTITVASATGIKLGQLAIPSTSGIIVAGTTVTGISGTTITLSANTTASASAGSAIAFSAGLGTNMQSGFPRSCASTTWWRTAHSRAAR